MYHALQYNERSNWMWPAGNSLRKDIKYLEFVIHNSEIERPAVYFEHMDAATHKQAILATPIHTVGKPKFHCAVIFKCHKLTDRTHP